MDKIIRGSGFTYSERYLNRLSDRTFLKLWTYPNTFSDRDKKGAGDGKEICDLLVVCGDDVIVFSDKSIEWPIGDDVKLSWSRWYRRAIKKSVDQIRGAERWLRDYPERIFIDSKCNQKLPIELPPLGRRRVHGIAIVRGAHDACSRYFKGDEGSLILAPHLKGDEHVATFNRDWQPFAIGDVDPSGPFVHVFDETALNLVMLEMDTITDFVTYLQARAIAIRDEDFLFSPDEAELLAYYMQTDPPENRPRFLRAIADSGDTGKIALWPGAYRDFVSSEEYARKKAADAGSYIWDGMISAFVRHLMAGSSISVLGQPTSASRAEPALRIMARENRLGRRVLGEGLSGVLNEAAKRPENRFARIAMHGAHGERDKDLAYVFMTLAHFEDQNSEKNYREIRVSMLETYCYAVLQEHRQLKRVVGIAMDKPGSSAGRSEDLYALEVSNWTPELEAHVLKRREEYEILVEGRLVHREEQGWEYPPQVFVNRQQRRAAERRAKKASRRHGG